MGTPMTDLIGPLVFWFFADVAASAWYWRSCLDICDQLIGIRGDDGKGANRGPMRRFADAEFAR